MRELELGGLGVHGKPVKDAGHSGPAVDSGPHEQAHLIEEPGGEEARVNGRAAHDGHALHAKLFGKDLARTGKVDLLSATGDPGDAQAVEVAEVLAAHGLARNDDERCVLLATPNKRAARVRDHVIARCLDPLGEALIAKGRRVRRGKRAIVSHLELGRGATAHARVRVERGERLIVLVNAAQLGRHGAVDAPVNGRHHVTDDARSLHGLPSSLWVLVTSPSNIFECAPSQACAASANAEKIFRLPSSTS